MASDTIHVLLTMDQAMELRGFLATAEAVLTFNRWPTLPNTYRWLADTIAEHKAEAQGESEARGDE